MDKPELVREAIALQRQVNHELRHQPPDAWLDLSLTIAQLKSLFFIAKGGANFRKLADALGVTPANVTGIVERLVEQEMVSRTENPEDRRMLLLNLTQKGQALLDGLRERQISRTAEILRHMDRDDLASLVRGLSALLKVCQDRHTPDQT
ncbi:MAG: MarR family transcriptional regulator [Chloroflexota bacterium]